VEFLHQNGIAHNDIKPSNVFLYRDDNTQRLLAKITDFGLAVGAKGEPKFESGIAEARSAFKYDAPEIRNRLRNTKSEIPTTFSDLLTGDIWKLAAVFTELLSHLVLKTNGVDLFRDFVTTTDGQFESDELSDITYDDGVKVKDEVRTWLRNIARLDTRAEKIVPLIQDMFGEASIRLKAEDVTRRLREVQLLP
jgi:serine/threonine protein kinase